MNHHHQPFQATVFMQGMTAEQFFELVKLAAREVMDERETHAAAAHADDLLPGEVPARQAATVCGYATAKSLTQYHFKKDGLTPIRQNGKRIFYAKTEVIALKKRLFK